MSAIHLSATVGTDGILHLEVPVGAAGDYEIVITPRVTIRTPTELGWPAGYFEKVVGSITDESFRRYSQGDQAPRVADQ